RSFTVGRWPTVRDVAKPHERPLGAALLARTEYRFGLVLVSLLATFVVLMVGSSSRWVRPVSVALTGTTLVAALFAADPPLRLRRIAATVSVVAFITSLSIAGLDRSGDGIAAMLDLALVALAPVAIARAVIRRRVFDVQTVMAALCIYVLLGLQWAYVYAAIGGLGASPFFAQPATPTSAHYLYFSFITQTTVGYGDLSAVTNPGRACAVLEALVGQLYLVTIVALVVSRVRRREEGGAPSTETGS